MTDEIDVERVASRAIQLLGGREQMEKIANAALAEQQRGWNQDVERIGRILRSHLYVEQHLTEYLAKANPRLGSLESARRLFAPSCCPR
jgi:hypothetical protein